MPFKISAISGDPVWDTLPVAKITNYPFEKEAFKPFAHVRACVSEKGLHLKMLAFETKKRPQSCIVAAFKLSDSRNLHIIGYADSHIELSLEENGDFSAIEENVSHNFFEGEDLEGIYWGVCVTISHELIAKYFDGLTLSAGLSFKGNFFKLCSDSDFDHAGCFSYVDAPHSVSFFDERRLTNSQ